LTSPCTAGLVHPYYANKNAEGKSDTRALSGSDSRPSTASNGAVGFWHDGWSLWLRGFQLKFIIKLFSESLSDILAVAPARKPVVTFTLTSSEMRTSQKLLKRKAF